VDRSFVKTQDDVESLPGRLRGVQPRAESALTDRRPKARRPQPNRVDFRNVTCDTFSPVGHNSLISEDDEPEPYAVLNPRGEAPALVVCDHASRAFPRRLGRLGLDELSTWQHIAWDIGAGELARGLSHALDAPAVLAGYSRLVVDLNRAPGDEEAIRSESDGCPIPGNQAATSDERQLRFASIFDAYHRCIDGWLDRIVARGTVPMLIAVHSFAPRLDTAGAERPWHTGVLWDHDESNARRLMQGLRAEPGLVVGDNEPYSGKHPANYTIDHHAKVRRLPHVCIEVRQDLLESPPGVEAWVYSRPYHSAGESDADVIGGGGDVHYISSCATGRSCTTTTWSWPPGRAIRTSATRSGSRSRRA